jgi:hypothetical protein
MKAGGACGGAFCAPATGSTGGGSGAAASFLFLGGPPSPFGAERVARDGELVGVVRQAIQCGGRERRTLEQIRPFGERAIRGDDHSAALVPLVDDVIEIFGCRRHQRFEAEVVQLCGASHKSIYDKRSVM